MPSLISRLLIALAVELSCYSIDHVLELVFPDAFFIRAFPDILNLKFIVQAKSRHLAHWTQL